MFLRLPIFHYPNDWISGICRPLSNAHLQLKGSLSELIVWPSPKLFQKVDLVPVIVEFYVVTDSVHQSRLIPPYIC